MVSVSSWAEVAVRLLDNATASVLSATRSAVRSASHNASPVNTANNATAIHVAKNRDREYRNDRRP